MKKILLIIFSVLILAAIFSGLAWHRAVSPADPEGSDVIFSVAAGKGIGQVSEDLYAQGLIKSPLVFETYVRFKGWEQKIIAGEHILNARLRAEEIASTLIKGNTVNRELNIRIIEGWNINDIDKYLSGNGVLGAGEFKALASLAKNQNPELKDLIPDGAPDSATLEGYLFPDTYRIFKGAGAKDIIAKMLSNFDKKFSPDFRIEIARQGRSLSEIVTMASLIEKEVRSAQDMKLVSGIFWNRIKNGQALQSCATLAYVLGVNKPQYSEADTKIDSPYNTYQNPGLPPGPIANPGLNAITAAIYPAATDYNFFLTAQVDGESKTIYSKNFEEHVRNKALYLK